MLISELCLGRTQPRQRSENHIEVNSLATTFLVIIAGAMLVVPRRYAALALFVGACYIPAYVGLQLGSFNFTAIRVLVAVGILRVLIRAEAPVGALNGIDRTMLVWAVWLVSSGFFHEEPSAALVFRLGLAYDAVGIYVLVRAYCRSVADIENICRTTAYVLVPLALAMLYEKLNAYNVFSNLGGVGAYPMIREGNVRANGPFAHPILAGTVGGVCLPLMIGLWRTRPARAVLGILACVAIIFSSASSGPILSAIAGIVGLCMWRYRNRMRKVQFLAVGTYVLLDIIMPGVNGFEVLRKLRAFTQLPVIAFSADLGNCCDAMRLGANDFITKPFQSDEMVRKIKALLSH